MNSALRKNIIKDIKDSKARFISIMLIVALGVGFFTGIKATSPSMNRTGEIYYNEHNLMDIRLLSTVGFSDDDVEEIKKLNHIYAAEGTYFTDAIVRTGGTDDVIRLYAAPQPDENGVVINAPVVKEGRLPEKTGEIAIESSNFSGLGLSIGDTLKLEDNVNGEKLTDTLTNTEYTIVGIVKSPLYVSYERGTTQVGSGRVSMFGIVSSEEFLSERYTQVYVLTDYSNDTMNTITEEFNSLIDEMKPELELLGEDRADKFDEVYLVEARQKLADAQEELDRERKKADKELADAKKKLDDAQEEYDTQVTQGQQKLDDAKRQIENAQIEIDNGWEQYNAGIEQGEKQIEDGKKQLAAAKQQLEDAKAEYNTQIREAEKQLKDAQRQYDKGLAEYQQGLTEFNEQTRSARLAITMLEAAYNSSKSRYDNITAPTANSVISEAQTSLDEAERTKAELEAQLDTASPSEQIVLKAQINVQEGIISRSQAAIDKQNQYLADEQSKVDEAKSKLDEAQRQFDEETAEPQAQLDLAKEQLESAKTQIDDGNAQLAASKEEGAAQLAEAQEQITQAETQLTDAQTELSKQKTEGRQKLKDAEEELEDAKKEYEDGKTEFEEKTKDGKEQLYSAMEEYSEAKSEAEASLKDAQSEIDKAAEKLDSLENPEWYIFTRQDNPGYSSYIDDTTRIDSVATVFPLFFLLVAVLVCLTTMTRHVEEKRTEIGTLKALGYSNSAITMKFLVYATSAAMIGCVLGITIGVFTLPYVVYNAYGIMYELQSLTLVMPWGVALLGIAAAFICTTFVALYTCWRSLLERPSSLMRPKAPKIGKRIFLERLPFIWKHMNFTSKVTARNIVRYKLRFFMTVIGIAGCTALMLTGFGLKDSISSVTDKQFAEINTYDMIAVLNSEGTEHQKSDVLEYVRSSEQTEYAMLDRQVAVEVTDEKGKNKQDEIYLFVPQSVEDMKSFLHLTSCKSGDPIELSDDGVVITEKMADSLGVTVDDIIIVTDDYRKYEMRVSDIAENYINGYVYITPQYYKTVYGKDVRFNMIMALMSDENEDKFGSFCLDNEDIAAVSFISSGIETFNDTISSLDVVILVLIVCAGLLAVVVLYNLTNINIAERVREIATIKVLGFYNGETCAFVYRENIILTLCGIFAGLGLGVILHRFVILTIEVNNVMFNRSILPLSYLYAALLTAVFAFIVNFIMYFKIKKIDMVESLKSVE